MAKKRDNTKKSRVEVKRGAGGKWEKGTPSPNPNGAPRRGQSLKEIAKTIGDMTPKEASDYCKAIAGRIGSIGGAVTLKEAVVLRIYTALLFEPDARLFNAIMDRDEGKVTQTITEMPWREFVKTMGYDPDVLMREAEEIVNRRFAELGHSTDNSRGDHQPQGVDDDSDEAD